MLKKEWSAPEKNLTIHYPIQHSFWDRVLPCNSASPEIYKTPEVASGMMRLQECMVTLSLNKPFSELYTDMQQYPLNFKIFVLYKEFHFWGKQNRWIRLWHYLCSSKLKRVVFQVGFMSTWNKL